MFRRVSVFQFKGPLPTSTVQTCSGAAPLIAMQACTHFEQHHKPTGIKAGECLCHIQRLLWQLNQWVIGQNNRCCIEMIYKSHWKIISWMAERNNFPWRESKLRFNSRVPWIPAAWMPLTLKTAQKASLVFVDPNMMCISDHVSKVSIEAVMLGFSGVFYNWKTMCCSCLMKRLLSSTPGPLPLMARVLICRLVSKPGVTDEARQSWGGGENSRLFHWAINFVCNKTMHPNGGCAGAEQAPCDRAWMGDCGGVSLERSDESNIL